MKRLFVLILSAGLLCAAAGAQESSAVISYALPRTVLTFEVQATQEIFYAGPYARFAKKYLGIQAGLEDRSGFSIASVSLHATQEADQSKRYTITINQGSRPTYMHLVGQGLIAARPEEGAPESIKDYRIYVKSEAFKF